MVKSTDESMDESAESLERRAAKQYIESGTVPPEYVIHLQGDLSKSVSPTPPTTAAPEKKQEKS